MPSRASTLRDRRPRPDDPYQPVARAFRPGQPGAGFAAAAQRFVLERAAYDRRRQATLNLIRRGADAERVRAEAASALVRLRNEEAQRVAGLSREQREMEEQIEEWLAGLTPEEQQEQIRRVEAGEPTGSS
ncbi:hypothetical protein JCM3775_006983 [Rhodotorula graminis]|uniref:Uncharacterized protein n=1 Tax=Rhodotorula graminis (strain WP1) TaxID=578459 RepID=A0A0P9IU71_RHOGW|nr:uncharacterized protein RHOBADRAFT_46057 [Rhodotorula graminis WP1]KPV72963.1 hypothetical protein RHOBADRAFT_46057 [Rhodotorula graminis WP1]